MDEKADHIKVEKRETFSDKKGGWVQRTTNNGAPIDRFDWIWSYDVASAMACA